MKHGNKILRAEASVSGFLVLLSMVGSGFRVWGF